MADHAKPDCRVIFAGIIGGIAAACLHIARVGMSGGEDMDRVIGHVEHNNPGYEEEAR